MKYKKVSENKYFLRFEKGEEIVEKLNDFLLKEDIKSGILSGIGAFSKAILLIFDTSEKKYLEKEYVGDYEVAALCGNISMLSDKPFSHIHAVLGDKENVAFAGHLKAGYVGGTCEVFLEVFDVVIERKYSPQDGLNLLDL